ncbi:hypothetical protein B0O99DRAFT_623756 [Bisporella sp. PMI_857]|nr:hypothetical protein B0O99DRAFT_623756 [Bisporella sp. PMI_857]
MFTHLPLEIRLLIWETILHQPRIVYINMRYLPDDPAAFCGSSDEGPEFECLCSTPVPVLLHLCSETRAIALAHYELTFGRANAPALMPRTVHKHWFGINGVPFETVIESNEAEVARYAPKIYFNFACDTVVFGRTLLPRGEAPGQRGRIMACFPYGKHFDFRQLQRIERLGLSISTGSDLDSMWSMVFYLNRHAGLGSFQRLKKLYLCLEGDDVDPGQGMELVDLRENMKEEEGDGARAREFVGRWGTALKGLGVVVNGEGMEGLRTICENGLKKRHQLRDLLLKNGASPDEVLKCVLVRNIGVVN